LEASVRLKFILESVSVKPTVAEIAL